MSLSTVAPSTAMPRRNFLRRPRSWLLMMLVAGSKLTSTNLYPFGSVV
jgi:hypothetical protein